MSVSKNLLTQNIGLMSVLKITDNGSRVCVVAYNLNKYWYEKRNWTTVSFDDWDNLEPYKWDIEYLKVVKRGNHEIIYRIQYE